MSSPTLTDGIYIYKNKQNEKAMIKPYVSTKVKTFRKWSKAEAMAHLGITENEYYTTLAFITMNNLTNKRVLHLYLKANGVLGVSLSFPKWLRAQDETFINSSIEPTGAPIPLTKKKAQLPVQAPTKPVNQGGYFVDTTIQPGTPPRIQARSTNEWIADATAIVSLVGLIAWAIKQWCNLFAGIGGKMRDGNPGAITNTGTSPITSVPPQN